MDKRKLRNDIILIGSILLVAVISLVLVFSLRKTSHLEAKVYVENDMVLRINLDKAEDKEYIIQGKKTEMTIATRNHAIGVISSGCPHHDCVNVGFVKETNRPIICTYNAVYIIIEGIGDFDLEV